MLASLQVVSAAAGAKASCVFGLYSLLPHCTCCGSPQELAMLCWWGRGEARGAGMPIRAPASSPSLEVTYLKQ